MQRQVSQASSTTPSQLPSADRQRLGRSTENKQRDRFARIPERIWQARRRGDFSFDEHAILVLLVEDADYRTGEVVGTLRSLADAWGWTKSPKQLSRVLHALRDTHHEISFEVEERQRKPWVIQVIGDGFGLLCDTDDRADVAVTGTSIGADDTQTREAMRSPQSRELGQSSVSDAETETNLDRENSALPPYPAPAGSGNGWPPELGRRSLADLLSACALVEDLRSGVDQGTLKAFVVDELPHHDAADFEHVVARLFEKRDRGGIGTPPVPIRNEAGFARHLLHDIEGGYE